MTRAGSLLLSENIVTERRRPPEGPSARSTGIKVPDLTGWNHRSSTGGISSNLTGATRWSHFGQRVTAAAVPPESSDKLE